MSEQKKEFKPDPEGQYAGTITGNRLVFEDDKNRAYFEVDMTLTHKIEPISYAEIALEKPLRRNCRIYIQENTLEFLPQNLAGLGYFGELDGLESAELSGNRCKFNNKHNKTDTGTFNNFSPFYLKHDAKPKPETTKGAGKKLQRMFGDSFKPIASDKPVEQKQKPQTQSTGTKPSGDELPF